tara:strand:- start:3355 stop:3606 length:252 start_codon:yes stop_codon:yes gene_type:complete
MPKYSYRCDTCESEYEVWHGMTEEHTNCNVCDVPSVVRIPSLLGEVSINTPKQRVGDVVNRTIEDTKKEVKEYKKTINRNFKL